MASPVTDVLKTYELLEAVLVNLPLKDLFVLQRVNSSWAAMIKRSAALQKIMFLHPENEPLGLAKYKRLDDTTGFYSDDDGPHYHGKVRLCPMLTIRCVKCSRILRNGDYPYEVTVFSPASATDSYAVFIDRAPAVSSSHETPRCGKMLLVQPPIKAVIYTAFNSLGGDTACTIYNPTGIRLMDIAHVREKYPEADRHGHESMLFSVTDGVPQPKLYCPCREGLEEDGV